MPHAMSWLWPTTTPGNPAKVNPLTSNGHASETSRQCRPACSQMPGWLVSRCGSLARTGAPEAVCSPETTHELEPMPSPAPRSRGTVARVVPAAARASSACPSASQLRVSPWVGPGGATGSPSRPCSAGSSVSPGAGARTAPEVPPRESASTSGRRSCGDHSPGLRIGGCSATG